MLVFSVSFFCVVLFLESWRSVCGWILRRLRQERFYRKYQLGSFFKACIAVISQDDGEDQQT
jgi:hypothetical protein